MSTQTDHVPSSERWANFRFSVIGPLLAAPPQRGQLQEKLQQLALQSWRHPFTGQPLVLGLSTIERWFYAARHELRDPVRKLRRKLRSDRGEFRRLSSRLRQLVREQFQEHPSWSYQLHVDNIRVLVDHDPSLGPKPGYGVVLRFMKSQGLLKRPRRGPVHSPGAALSEQRFQAREVRSYQSDFVNGLWHLDFHNGSRRVLLPDGQWAYPDLFGALDDCSRLCCHAQWYLRETSENLVHGLSQAMQKRQLPRALMSDNGSAEIAEEVTQGLKRLGVLHETTLPYSPYQNGKQEAWWTSIESRLLPMLEGVADLTLAQLNQATLAWMELDYNRKVHSELKRSPLEVFLHHRDVGRPCPSSEALQQAFTVQVTRTQRRSDGTFTLDGRRFELPSRYAHFQQLSLRYARWDLSHVYLADPQTSDILQRVFPLDKSKNADGRRARRATPAPLTPTVPSGMAPLLQQIITDYAATGLPAAYLPKDEPSSAHLNSSKP